MNLPFSDFTIFDVDRNPRFFEFYSSKIKRFDTAFFQKQSQFKNYLFFFVLDIEYEPQSSKFFSIDFASFPQKIQVEPEQLSWAQRNLFAAKKTAIPKNTRLVSTCQQTCMSDYSENVLLACLFYGGRITNVRKIIRCKAYYIFTSYINTLNKARAHESSAVSNQIFKGLSNSLAGAGWKAARRGRLTSEWMDRWMNGRMDRQWGEWGQQTNKRTESKASTQAHTRTHTHARTCVCTHYPISPPTLREVPSVIRKEPEDGCLHFTRAVWENDFAGYFLRRV